MGGFINRRERERERVTDRDGFEVRDGRAEDLEVQTSLIFKKKL